MSVYHTVLEAYNITRNKSSDQLHQKFMHEGKHSERSAAKNYLYLPEKPPKRCTGFSYIGPKLYNMIPKNIKEAQTTKAQPMQKLITYALRDHPFKTSACLRGGGGVPIADVCRC